MCREMLPYTIILPSHSILGPEEDNEIEKKKTGRAVKKSYQKEGL
jgi:hypothetical protein